MLTELLFDYIWLVLVKGFFYVALLYYFYTRVIDVYLCYSHYKNQNYKVTDLGLPLPVIGNMTALLKCLTELIRTDDHKIPFARLIE